MAGTGAKLIGAAKWQLAMARRTVTLKAGVKKGLRGIAVEVSRQAKLRVPVSGGVGRDKETGRFKSREEGDHKPGHLRQSIRWEVIGTTSTTMEARIGTNVEYGVYLEYGTDRIAGGDVKALGMGDEIQDSQAIFSWPALEARKASNQQMPWLRPAANIVRPMARAIMISAMRKAGKKVKK